MNDDLNYDLNDDQQAVADNFVADAIDAAEDIVDPLDGLVEKTTVDSGSAFQPEVLERLAALKKDDRAAFERLRTQLKKAGCRVTALDESADDRPVPHPDSLAAARPGRALPSCCGKFAGRSYRSPTPARAPPRRQCPPVPALRQPSPERMSTVNRRSRRPGRCAPGADPRSP